MEDESVKMAKVAATKMLASKDWLRLSHGAHSLTSSCSSSEQEEKKSKKMACSSSYEQEEEKLKEMGNLAGSKKASMAAATLASTFKNSLQHLEIGRDHRRLQENRLKRS